MDLLSGLKDRIFNKFSIEDILFHVKFEVESHVVKKNNRPIFKAGNKPFLGKSPRLRSAESFMEFQFKSAANELKLIKPIDIPVWCIFLFHFQDFYTQKGTINKKMPDLSNLYQLPEDCLQRANILIDDNLIMSHDLSRRLPAQKNELEIFILTYADRI